MPWDKQTEEEIATLENAICCLDEAIVSFDATIKWCEHFANSESFPPGWEKSGLLHIATRLKASKRNLVALRKVLPQGRLYEELRRSKTIRDDIEFAARRMERISDETGNPNDARAHEKLVQVLRRLEEC